MASGGFGLDLDRLADLLPPEQHPALSVECPLCDAYAGEPCRTLSGLRMERPHGQRAAAAKERSAP